MVILVAGFLFYFVSEPLASAFDLFLPKSFLEVEAEPPPAVPEEPEEPPPPTAPLPKIWTPAEIESGLTELATSLPSLAEAGDTELPTYEDLGSADEAMSQRATARWSRWGVVWHNRIDVERAKMPPREQCSRDPMLQASCVEVHDILDQLEVVSRATTYDDAEARLEAATDRLDLYLHPPPPPEDELGDETESLDVAESTQ